MNTDFFLAILAAYIVMRIFHGVLNRMTRGVPNPIRCAVALLILPGIAARLLYPVLGEWGEWADVLLLGGLALLFAVDRRAEAEALTPRGLVARLALIAAMIGGGLVSAAVHAEPAALAEPAFVVALAKLDGKPYGRTVILAAPFKGGHFGVILNLPTEITLGLAFPEHGPSKAVRHPIYFGGPETPDSIFAMIRSEAAPAGRAIELMRGVWLLVSAKEVDQVIERTPNEARYYAGFVYWGAGELAEELSAGLFALRPADVGKLFLEDTAPLYNAVVPLGRDALPAARLGDCPC